jgi:hypothetical protein
LGFGFGVLGFENRILKGSGSRVKVWGLEIIVQGSRFRVWGVGIRG